MLLFKERFKSLVLDGTKTVTRRGLRRKFNVGSVHQAYTRPPFCTPPGAPFAKLKVLEVTVSAMRDIDEAEARAEGFANLDELWAYFTEKDGSVDLSSEFTRIKFEVVE
jgi:hypothetical protein